MAGHRVTGHRVTTTAGAGAHPQARVDAYLGELDHLLHGPRRRRAQILAELRDGIEHAIADQTTSGTGDQAVASAINRFGTPEAVAAAFAGELATAYARHTIAWYIATGPLIGIWWLLLLHPDPGHTGLLAALAAIPVIPLIGLAIATAAGTLATTGRLIRWLPEATPHRALAATSTVATLALAADLAVITLYLRSAAPGQPLAIVAVGASLIRIAGSLVTLRHATQMRHRDPLMAAGPADTRSHDAHR